MLNNPRSGFNMVGEYQIAGIPWVVSGTASTSAACIPFDYVTRAITVTNNAATGTFLRIGFTQNGVNGTNYYSLDGGKAVRLEVRVRDLWLRTTASTADYSVCAEVTSIERRNMLPLTGSVDTSTHSGRLAATGSIVVAGVG